MTSLLFSASDDADIFDDLAAQIGGGDTAAANVEMTTSTAAVFNSIEIPKSIEHLDDTERDSLFEYVVGIIYQFNGYVPPLHRSYINQIAGNNTAETKGVTTTLNMRNGCDFSKISSPSYNNFLFLYI